uniref:Uncharacterized protein n=1 Tax=Timema poppense TaxID=170557 RepID=A0A7R9H9K3_TIMPO|nr:unnamed protein product [Timema poppensis]
MDDLKDLIDAYNGVKHSSIKMAHVDVTETNVLKVRDNLYGNCPTKHDNKPKLKVGDTVLINKAKMLLDKGYESIWSEEIFKTVSVVMRQPAVYRLVDAARKEVEGTFTNNNCNTYINAYNGAKHSSIKMVHIDDSEINVLLLRFELATNLIKTINVLYGANIILGLPSQMFIYTIIVETVLQVSGFWVTIPVKQLEHHLAVSSRSRIQKPQGPPQPNMSAAVMMKRAAQRASIQKKVLHAQGELRADFGSLRWNSKLSIRSNQDNQRTEEETKLRRLNQYLIYVSRRLPYSETPTLNPMNRSSSHYHGINWTQHVVPKGGLFVRLEQDWRESHSFPHASAIGRRGGGKRSRSDVCKS